MNHQPLEAEPLAEQVGEDRGRERGGHIGGREGGDGDMRRHDGVDARFDGRLERNQLEAFEAVAVGGNGGEVDVRVDGGVSMSGEVLDGREHERFLVGARALDEGLHVRGDGVRVFSEGADVDDRIVGVVVDVRDRVVDPVDAEGAGLARRDLTLAAREGSKYSVSGSR